MATRMATKFLKPTLKYEIDGDRWTQKLHSTFKNHEITFELNKQFEESTADGRKVLVSTALHSLLGFGVFFGVPTAHSLITAWSPQISSKFYLDLIITIMITWIHGFYCYLVIIMVLQSYSMLTVHKC